MGSSELEMSLEQIPVLMKKTQMNGDRAGSQCGLTSLLPMSCRGRAAAFARDLHSRLRNLGTAQEDESERSWLANNRNNRPGSSTERDHDTFYDFELECESPSSPVEEYDAPFSDRPLTDDQEPPFYDVDSEVELKEQTKLKLHQPDKSRNGFRFSTSFYTDTPVKIQPIPRENGHLDKPLYSPITFEGCARQNSSDEIDCAAKSSSVSDDDRLESCARHNSYDEINFAAKSSSVSDDDRLESCERQNSYDEINCAAKSSSVSDDVRLDSCARQNSYDEIDFAAKSSSVLDDDRLEGCTQQNSFDEIDCAPKSSSVSDVDRLSLPVNLSANVDSDSEFESAKSDPSDGNDDVFQSENRLENDVTEVLENVSLSELPVEIPTEDDFSAETTEELPEESHEVIKEPLEIVTSEVLVAKELSPAIEIEPSLLSAEDAIDDHDEIEDDRPQRVRRCSSLKTGKTPPGTPGRKKIVRFADVLGLDLADVKTFMDEIPVIPKSAYDDLTGCDVQSSPPARTPPRLGALTLVPLFQLAHDVTEKLEKQNVCLESARVCDGVHVTVCGSVRVRNLDFHKTVHIRYTMNRWKTYTDLQTTYVQGSCDGYSDRFQFVLYTPCISSGQRLEIAVRFQCKGQQFWDNNNGANYCFDCLALGAITTAPATTAPLHPTVDWHPSFY